MKRRENESYDDYKARRKSENKRSKQHLRGRPVRLTRKEIVVP